MMGIATLNPSYTLNTVDSHRDHREKITAITKDAIHLLAEFAQHEATFSFSVFSVNSVA